MKQFPLHWDVLKSVCFKACFKVDGKRPEMLLPGSMKQKPRGKQRLPLRNNKSNSEDAMSEDSFDDEEDFDIEELSEAEEMLTDLELQCSGQDTVQESRSCKT